MDSGLFKNRTFSSVKGEFLIYEYFQKRIECKRIGSNPTLKAIFLITDL